jgi:hypothetical protein
MNLFFLSIWCVGRAVDSTRQLSLTFQLWFQGLQRLCFRWRFLVRRDVVSLANPSVNDDSIFSVDFIRQSWISVRCRFHQSAATQFSTMISRSIVMNLFLLSICCVGRAVESTRQLSLRFQLWFQGLQRLCFRWRFMARSDTVSLEIPCVNDDSVSLISCVNRELVFVVDSISRPRLNFQRWFLVLQWLSFQGRFLDQLLQSVCDNSILNHQSNYVIDLLRRSCCRFHTSAVTQILVVISRSTTTMFSLQIYG